MSKNSVRRGVLGAVLLAGVGASTALATTANAATEPQLCKDVDVRVTVTQSPEHSMGHHADVLHYRAANAGTHCVVQGAPYSAVFYDRSGAPLGVPTSAAPGGPAPTVTIDAGHSASSYAVIPDSDEPGPNSVLGVRFHLPSDASRTPIGAAWPANDLTGPVQFSALFQS